MAMAAANESVHRLMRRFYLESTLTASTVLVSLLMTDEIRDGTDVGLPDPTPAVVGGTLIGDRERHVACQP